MKKDSVFSNLLKVLNTVPVGVVLSPSKKGGEIYCNDKFLTLVNIKPHVLHNANSLNNLLRLAGIDEFDLTRLLKGIESKNEFQEHICCKKGKKQLWLDIKITKWLDENNKNLYCWVFEDITVRKELTEKLGVIEREIKNGERLRIANDLHDGIGQILTAINLHVQSLENDINRNSERNKNSLVIISDLVRKAIAETKFVAHNLVPDILELKGLEKAIEILLDDVKAAREDVEVIYSGYLEKIKLTKEIEVGIYRIAQEIINNFLKHSNGNFLKLSLSGTKKMLRLHFIENGDGFEIDFETSKRLGVRGMSERVKNLRGTLVMESSKIKGVEIEIKIPLEK